MKLVGDFKNCGPRVGALILNQHLAAVEATARRFQMISGSQMDGMRPRNQSKPHAATSKAAESDAFRRANLRAAQLDAADRDNERMTAELRAQKASN